MSAGNKRDREEAEEHAAQASKKVKTEDAVAETNGETPVKKSKKDKKEKKEKKSKKKSKSDTEATATPSEDATPAATEQDVPMAGTADEQPEAEVPKEKKDKKERKEKKEKKNKESKSAEPEQAAPAPSSNGTTNGKALSSKYSYSQTSSLSALPQSDIDKFLAEKEITITDSTTTDAALRPVLQFDQLPTSTLLSKKPFGSFSAPTPIQSASWPYALSGRDVVGVAETGSGKTYAFSVPLIESLMSTNKLKKTRGSVAFARAVVVSPTRELAMQTHEAIEKLAGLVGMSAVCIYGGASKDAQRSLLLRNSGADIIVATPGRLKDFLSEGCIDLSEATFAVLDEADRMLDKGFEDDIRLILGSCKPREQRQTLMFTATWPMTVRALAETFMVTPVKITIGGRAKFDEDGNVSAGGALELQANTRITQKVEVVDPRGKEFRLFELLKEAQKGAKKDDRILVFCLYKKECTRVEQFLERKGIRVVSIHGDLRQEQRTRSLEAFKAGTTTVLVATDVAARGLDIPEVKLVINLTFPLTIEDYVHRIGRTGRAGKQGNAITLFTEHDKAHSGSLINILKAANQDVPESLMKFGTTVKKKAHDSYGAFYKEVDMSVKPKKIVFD
ncbi:ATP-dependent RNA helicase dbp-3 [Coniochaeta sp. 2T2.1]|nr:ATP-dependent RNA helicase dbp-3 [Coniochaeta sp. 2T2.1]